MGPIWTVQDDYLKTMNLMTSAKSLLSGEVLYSQFLGIRLWTSCGVGNGILPDTDPNIL